MQRWSFCTRISVGVHLERIIDAQAELCESSDSVHGAHAELAACKDTRKQLREKNIVGRLDDVSCGEKQIAREHGH